VALCYSTGTKKKRGGGKGGRLRESWEALLAIDVLFPRRKSMEGKRTKGDAVTSKPEGSQRTEKCSNIRKEA